MQMRLRTKLFTAWVCLTLILWGGAFWVINRSVEDSFDRLDRQTFAGISRGLRRHYRDRVRSLQQACELVMNIPDLRALIAEQNFEFVAENQASLTERLNYLDHLVGADFVVALNRAQLPIAQNDESPWPTIEHLDAFLSDSPLAAALLDQTAESPDRGHHGMWVCRGRLYQVAAVPLIFQAGERMETSPEGMLVMGERITDVLSEELGEIHNCQVSFVADGAVVASSLPAEARQRLMEQLDAGPLKGIHVRLGGVPFRTVQQPLVDPASGTQIAEAVIQRSQAHSQQFMAGVSRQLAFIMLGGLLLAAALSFALSSAISRPVNELAAGVRSVALGHLNLALRVHSQDELGELAMAFNQMVREIRVSREELQQANDQLEQRVAKRTRLLSSTNAELTREIRERKRAEKEADAANQAKSDFLANLSHEIRTPMTAIMGFSEQLLGAPLSDDQRNKSVEIIRHNSQHLLDLINDILDLSKVEAGKLEVDRLTCSPIQLIAEVASLMQIRARAKGIDFVVEFDGPMPESIQSDPLRLRQILVNFVGNAIKFTEKGHVRLRARLLDQLPNSGDDDAPMLRFDVIDTGLGMTYEQQERIFQPFTQADQTTTRRFGGTGLGLTISKRLAELLGGQIQVVSSPGQGSTFTLVVPTGPLDGVPLIERPAEVVRCEPQCERPAHIDLAGCRVLLAEDRLENQELIAFILRQAAAEVEVADNGQLAIDRVLAADAKGEPFDVILMDMQMPVVDGYTSTRILRGKGYQMPIIALTAHAMKGDRKKCLDAGCTDHVTKPIDTPQLLATIARLASPDPRSAAAGPPQKPGRSAVDSAELERGDRDPNGEPPFDDARVEPPIDFAALLQRCLGHAQLVESLLGKFPSRVESQLQEIQCRLADQDAEEVSRLAHSLKGAAANLAAGQVSRVAARLESLARPGNLDEARDCFEMLRQAWQRCRDQIPDLLATSGQAR